MPDVVIAPDLDRRYEQIKGLQKIGVYAQDRLCSLEQELSLIERVSKAEQDNVALRAEVAKLEAQVKIAEKAMQGM